jgi:hypothetical protein
MHFRYSNIVDIGNALIWLRPPAKSLVLVAERSNALSFPDLRVCQWLVLVSNILHTIVQR